MVSDSELIGRLREFLRNSDLDTTTTAIVRRKLEEDFGVDLSDKKRFIRDQVDLFLQTEHERADQEEDGGDCQEDAKDDGDEKLKTEEEHGDSEVGENSDDDNHEKGKAGSNKLNKEVKKRGGGFNKPCSLSPQLQEFIGVPEMARTEVVKQLWNHIRGNTLQDPSNRRNIICDEPLKALFGVHSINMFQMNKALSKHIWPLESNDVIPAKSSQKEKQQKEKPQKEKPQKEKPQKKRQKQGKEEDSDDSVNVEKRQKKGKSGFLAPLQLSEALVTFLGTGENELSRSDVVKRMWDYIKKNNLQDPSDKRRIICDTKLKELFDVDSFHGFTVSKLLTTHFVKTKQT